jgi:hypothetical protein
MPQLGNSIGLSCAKIDMKVVWEGRVVMGHIAWFYCE